MGRRAAGGNVQECECTELEEFAVLLPQSALLGLAFLLGDVVVAGRRKLLPDFSRCCG